MALLPPPPLKCCSSGALNIIYGRQQQQWHKELCLQHLRNCRALVGVTLLIRAAIMCVASCTHSCHRTHTHTPSVVHVLAHRSLQLHLSNATTVQRWLQTMPPPTLVVVSLILHVINKIKYLYAAMSSPATAPAPLLRSTAHMCNTLHVARSCFEFYPKVSFKLSH